jgi:hypothetical protein
VGSLRTTGWMPHGSSRRDAWRRWQPGGGLPGMACVARVPSRACIDIAGDCDYRRRLSDISHVRRYAAELERLEAPGVEVSRPSSPLAFQAGPSPPPVGGFAPSRN